MILQIIVVLILVIILAIIASCVENKFKSKKKIMSFKEAMDLAELPVVTFYQGHRKFNFLLDTGSNYSHICGKAAEYIKGTISEAKGETSGIGGECSITHVISAALGYNDTQYVINLCVTPSLDDTFTAIKKETGITVHGIIGNSFMQKYKYVLDFDKLIAYGK
jgi:hypothetical protein